MLDALAAAGAVARAACVLAGERSPARLGVDGEVPRRIEEVTAAWLGRALAGATRGARVAAIRVLDRSAGTTNRVRVAVDYDPPAPGAPASVFVKLAPAGTATRLFCNLMQLGTTEVRFYRELGAAVPVRVPAAYHAAGDRTEAFVLVLEDLAARAATFSDVARPATAEVARAVVTELARLHAAYWNSPRLRGDLAWLRAPGRNPGIRLERALCAAALGPGLGRFPELVPATIRAAAGRIVDARDTLDARWAAGDLTLLHGDSHLGNLFFLDGRVGFLDWQVAQRGPGMRDVSYFLVTSLPTEVRRAHERTLIAHYLACLTDAGAAAPTFDEAWHQHRLLACHAWVAAIVTTAATTLQIEAIARAGVARANQALVDLDSLGALAAIGT